MTFKRKSIPIIGVVALAGLAIFLYAGTNNAPTDTVRSVSDIVQRYHVSPLALNDVYSKRVFDLYLKRIDPGKRFLIQSDIDQLKYYETRLDDDMKSDNLEFVALANRLIKQRVADAKILYTTMIQTPQDFESKEVFETDGEKRTFAKNKSEWEADWRKFIKYQVLTTYIISAESATRNPSALSKQDAAMELDARHKVEKNLDSFFDRMSKETDEDRINAFIDCVANANDPHTSYLAPQQKDDFDINIKGSLEGIGAVLQEEDGYIKVTRIVPGGPAWRQKELKAQDIILKVAQDEGESVDIVGARVQDAVKLIRGSKGTRARLTVKKPDGKIAQISIIRDVVVLEESYSKSAIIKTPDGQKFGYILLPSFYRDFANSKARNASDDLRNELRRLNAQGVKSIILDLRNNGGGALEDAVKVAGLFIDYGPVVQVRDRANRGYTYEDTDPAIVFDGDVVVLVNTFSASASEIVAGALQDYGRAVIIGGAHTYGKGTVQTVLNLDTLWANSVKAKAGNGGSVKVTNQKYFRVTGASTQFKGVEPDITLPDFNDYLEVGEQTQSYPLPWTTTSAAPIRKWGRPVQPSVLALSKERTQNDPNFNAMATLVSKLRQRRKNSSYPLQLTAAVKMQQESKQDTDSLDQIKLANSNKIALPSEDDYLKELEPERATEYQEWLKQLPKDIYIDEAVSVLKDMRAMGPGESSH